MKIKKTTKECYGCFSNLVVKTSRMRLTKKFGKPSNINEDEDEKVQYEWNLSLSNGTLFYIYDWKEYHRISSTEVIEWHIGMAGDKTDKQKEDVIASLKELGLEVIKH